MTEAAALPLWKKALRPLYVPVLNHSPEARMLVHLVRARQDRNTALVRRDYSSIWNDYMRFLERAQTLDDWLFIQGYDDVTTAWFQDGQVRHSVFDFVSYYADEIANALQRSFPNARSVTEYGCGVGRITMALKQRLPHLECFGYELCDVGVGIARTAAAKFGVSAEFAQLDYINAPEDKYVHPPTDVAFTVFSLEQIPHASSLALRNMLAHSRQGSLHLEPVAENYPRSRWGFMGRVYTKQVDYLQNFDASARALNLADVSYTTLPKSHNPCIPAPSLYVLRK